MERSTPDCLIRLKAQYNRLSPAVKKVADFILAHPNEVLEHNIIELAEMIHVSQFSIINCIKTTGHIGYRDFKLALAREMDTADLTATESVAPDDTPYSLLQKVSSMRIRSISDTLHLIDTASFSQAVEMIAAAHCVELFGIGYSFFAAEAAATNFLRLGIRASAQRDASYQNLSASLLGPGALAIGFSVQGESSGVVSSLDAAKSHGASAIAITSYADSPITHHADLVLMTTCNEPMFPSDISNAVVEQAVLVSALTVALASRNKTLMAGSASGK
jgi:DNA-binding MurR/RpiR family transcriptional regulator